VIVDLADLGVVDGHCHPLLPDPWGVSPSVLLDRFSEGRPGAMAAHVPHTGYYRRATRALAALYRVEPTPEAILARRQAVGPETAQRLLVDRRVARLLVDTGYPPQAMALAAMRELLPCPIHEVFRIERGAEALLARALPYPEFLEAFRGELRVAAERCVGLKTVIAYRSGLAIRTWDPGEIGDAYRRALAQGQAGGGWRLTDKPLLDSLFAEALAVAGATGRPLQIHTGFGDPDIDLLQANPLLLRPILEDPAHAGVRLVLLHMAYPYCREAAFMAAVWPQVFVDLSQMPPFLGPGSIPPLLEILALAPTSKLLYGSDVGALPELFALAAEWTRAALGEALGWLVERGELTTDEARGAGRRILSENALALYGLPSGDR
jgi:predicted TIM-barrel fold metal-dependent hydrolase